MKIKKQVGKNNDKISSIFQRHCASPAHGAYWLQDLSDSLHGLEAIIGATWEEWENRVGSDNSHLLTVHGILKMIEPFIEKLDKIIKKNVILIDPTSDNYKALLDELDNFMDSQKSKKEQRKLLAITSRAQEAS